MKMTQEQSKRYMTSIIVIIETLVYAWIARSLLDHQMFAEAIGLLVIYGAMTVYRKPLKDEKLDKNPLYKFARAIGGVLIALAVCTAIIIAVMYWFGIW